MPCKILSHEAQICFAMETSHFERDAKYSSPRYSSIKKYPGTKRVNLSQFMSRNLIFNTESQNFIIPGYFQKCSGTLDIAWKWPIFCQFQCLRYFSHLFFGLKLDFECGIKKFHHSWNLPGIIWNSGTSLDMAYSLLDSTHFGINST